MGCAGSLGYDTGVQAEEFRALVKGAVEDGTTLSRAEARGLLEYLLTAPEADAASHNALAALLAVMARRGETGEELCGFAEAMRAAATRIPLEGEERGRLVDTCGTGGDGLDTLNISTAAGLVAAGAGASIAKHGNRAVTSRFGSADVLEALGVPITLDPEAGAACLRECGFLFMLAPGLHPSMRRVAPVRRALPFRTIFNLAGPLTNPACAAAQVVGVWGEERIPVVAEALRLLGVRHAIVVHGRVAGSERGLDELTVTGDSLYAEVRDGWIAHGVLDPASLGLSVAPLSALRGGGTAHENAALVEQVLSAEERGARREIVLLNAGAALVVAGMAADLREGLERAREAVDSGAATATLRKLRAFRARHAEAPAR